MRLLSAAFMAVVASLLPFSAVAENSHNNSISLPTAISLMPKCALTCLLKSVTDTGCDPTDKTCICTLNFGAIEKTATPCIQEACTFADALQAKNLTALSCDAPVRDRTVRYNVMAVTLGIITNVLVIVRLIFKRFYSYRRAFGWDDYTILIALLIGIPATILNVLGLTANGMGRDVWTLTTAEINRFGAYFYMMEVLYMAEIACIKLSLSVFYLYIFPGEWTRRLLWATVIFNIASGVAFVVTGLVQCVPIPYFWHRYTDPSAVGHCININAFGWTHAAVSIAVDVWMLAIPLSQLRKLQLHWKKKIGVTVMFLIGTFVTIVSILRLQSLIYLARSVNPTWDEWLVAWWSTIEVHVGLICACLPTLRLVLVRICPRVFSTNMSRNKSVTERRTRPNSSAYIMQSKEITLSTMEIELGASSSPEIGGPQPRPTTYSKPQGPPVPPKDWH